MSRLGLSATRLLPVLLLLGLVIPGCSGKDGDHPRAAAGTPIVLISVDTLRSDRLPAYGYREIETPALDTLRRDSILYLRAYSPVPLTLPAHATLLTGLQPPAHGVRDNMGYRLDPEGLPYLPRILKDLGYATGAAVSSFVLRGASGLAGGFDFYEDRLIPDDEESLAAAQRPGTDTLEHAVEWLRSVRQRPFLLFFHIYEPHTPHQPPERIAARSPSPYDGEVVWADEIVGALLAELRSLDLYDRSIVVFLSDHGEGLGEHGFYEHGPLLYREALQVPLLLKLPDSERGGSTVERAVHLADVAPTLLSLLGVETPGGLAGVSLLAAPAAGGGERLIYGETLYPRIHFGWSDLASLIEYPYHYIDGPDPELYDLEADAAETVNILRQQRRLAEAMKRRLATVDRAFAAPGAEDPETRRRLEALGYVGTVQAESEGPLADPKARLHVLETLKTATAHSKAGRLEEAVAALREVVREEPGMVDAWEMLGARLTNLGRHAEAVAAFEEAMRRSGGAPHVALAAATAFLKMGRLDEAEAHARVALEGHELARGLLAQILLEKGELDRAEPFCLEAVELRGARLAPLITLAELRLKQGRLQEAIDISHRVEREFGARQDRESLRGLYFIRGQAYAKLGESGPAAEAFGAEIEISPSELAPYTHLSFLYALEGKGPEAGRTLHRMVTANPQPRAYAEAVRVLRAIGDPSSATAVLRDALRRWPSDPELRELGP